MLNNKLDEIEERELDFKLEVIMYFLIVKDGYLFRLYNHPSLDADEPDSNIVEYLEDVINLIKKLKG